MRGPAWTAEELGLIGSLRSQGVAVTDLPPHFPNRTRQAVLRAASKVNPTAKGPAVEESTHSGDTWDLHVKTHQRIVSLDDLVRYCKIDLDVWEVEKWTCNKWEVGAKDANLQLKVKPLFQVKAFLRRRTKELEVRRRVVELIADAKTHAPVYLPIERPAQEGAHLVLITMPDLHLGKLAWREESGTDYDIKLAVAAWQSAVMDLLGKVCAYSPNRVLLVFGNDFLNADNLVNTTTRGTQQHDDVRYQKVYKVGRELLVWTIEQARILAPVDVVMVPGNHDAQSTFTLGDSLYCWFHLADDVAIDNQPRDRKYVEYGLNMFCFAHGDEVKPKDLPMKMASEQPEMWGRTVYREAHTGHLHQVQLQEIAGVYVRINPALTATDAWHFNHGYTCMRRSAEAFVYHREGGLVGHVIFNLDRAAGKAA